MLFITPKGRYNLLIWLEMKEYLTEQELRVPAATKTARETSRSETWCWKVMKLGRLWLVTGDTANASLTLRGDRDGRLIQQLLLEVVNNRERCSEPGRNC